MACIKPPAEVTVAVPAVGPTCAGHVFTIETRHDGSFGGAHHLSDGPTLYTREAPVGLSADEVVIDFRSGSSLVDAVVKDEDGVLYSKGLHTMFNPQLSQAEVVAEIYSVRDDPSAEREPQGNGRTRITGVSANGISLTVVVESNGEIVTAFPYLPNLTFGDG